MLLLFASGAAALIYQVLWIKQLALVVGVDVQAVTTGVSAFFAGLALGGWVFGRIADRSRQPLRLYSVLEVLALVSAICGTFALAHAAAPFAVLQGHVGALAWVLPFALVGLPAVAMGGTLPVLLRAVEPKAGGIGGAGGRLYAANTAGAIAGATLPTFVLIPWLGVQGSAFAAAVLNAIAAGVAVLLARGRADVGRGGEAGSGASGDHAISAAARSDESSASTPLLPITLYAIAGGIALGYEVIWSQAIVQFISTRSFAFSIVLATYLCGLVLGSAAVSRRVDRVRDPWGAFALLIASAGLAAMLAIAFLGGWLISWQSYVSSAVLSATGNLLASMCASFAVAALCIVFVPTLLLGAAFPFALRLTVDHRRVGRDVGALVAMNTAGGIAGTLLAGFVLVPWLGLVHSLAALAVAACAVGLVAVLCGPGTRRASRFAVGALAVFAACAAVFTPSDRLAALLSAARGGTLVHYEESAGGTVAVVEQTSGTHRFKRLYIQGVSNSGDTMTSLRYMRLQALLPLIIHRDAPRSALVIGLGTGITGGALLTYPGLDRRVVAELLPAVARAAPQFSGNYGMSTDPRIDVRLRDGRRELLQSAERYDLITLEPPPPSAAGVVNLYSTDFYRLAAARLQPDGIVAQWLPLPTQNENDTRALIQSFIQVFPHASLWTTELHEMMLVGSMTPIGFDVSRISARFAQPAVSKALEEVGVASPAALMATWVTDRAGLAYYVADTPPVTDDAPRIEYAPWVRRAEFPAVLARLMALQAEPPLTGGDDAFRAAMQRERETLRTFYGAGLAAYRGDREAWARAVQRVMSTDGANPYYRWFVGEAR
ncbi:fused MFS/spermidine synthase [Caballeronia terrestris]|nr:fused MFS/spermidine synthase [Caballeronia terrestris]